ncbi:hypothetical protein AVEN_187355-1 [Araneus ventricosus]|uniref:Uncharacterized protein n=1 Tax=Araneus ventricosus TaxID=182803 RepID=A0A4Y2Q7A5_ARAVE|nr:hypothetical protein AVEN_187355-1 [Araneus ventricosus]
MNEQNKFGRGWRTDSCRRVLRHVASSFDAEEELISASASNSRDCKILFSNGGRTAIGKSSMSTEVGLVVGKGFNAD